MSDSRLAAIRREFTENLRALRFLAEAQSSTLDAEKISRGKSEGNAPRGGHATMDEALERYEKVNVWVERKRGIAVLTGWGISHDEYVQRRVLHLLKGARLYELDRYDDANGEVAKLVAREKRRQAPLRDLRADERNMWIIDAGEGRDAFVVAEEFSVSVDLVLTMRSRHGRRLDNGNPKVGGRGRPSTAGGRRRIAAA